MTPIPLLRDAALKHEDADCRAAAIYALQALNDSNIVEMQIDRLSVKEYASEYEDSVCNIAANILSKTHAKQGCVDEAVCAAYGWTSDLRDEEILEKPLALNLERAKG